MSWNYATNEPESDAGGADYLRRLKADQQRARPATDDQTAKEDQPPSVIAPDPLLVPAPGTARESQPATATSTPDPNERRRAPRFKCEGSAEFRVGGTDVRTWGTFTDLSVHGCYIEMTATFPVGAMVDLVLGLNGFRINVKGEVRVSYPFLGIGVAFRDLSPENERELRQMVNSLMTMDAPANPAAAAQTAKGQPSIVAIASPEIALQKVVDFFQTHSLLSRDEFLQLLRKNQQPSSR
jgi:hypothetical protein